MADGLPQLGTRRSPRLARKCWRWRSTSDSSTNVEPTPLLALFQLLEVLLDHLAHGGRDVGPLHVVARRLGVLGQNITVRPRCAAYRKRLIHQVLIGGAVARATGHEDVLGGLASRRGLALTSQAGSADARARAGPGR